MFDLKAIKERYQRNELLVTDVPSLIAEVERLWAEIELLRLAALKVRGTRLAQIIMEE